MDTTAHCQPQPSVSVLASTDTTAHCQPQPSVSVLASNYTTAHCQPQPSVSVLASNYTTAHCQPQPSVSVLASNYTTAHCQPHSSWSPILSLNGAERPASKHLTAEPVCEPLWISDMLGHIACLGATAMIIFASSGNRTPNQGRQGHNLVITPKAFQQSREMPLESINQDTIETWPGSSIGLATCYRLDGPGIESRWGQDCPHPSRQPLKPTQRPVHRYRGSLRR
jgi:hypothetical protein